MHRKSLLILAFGGLATAGIAYLTFLSSDEQDPQLGLASRAMGGKNQLSMGDGASTYLANLAIAQAQADKSNPLVGYIPVPGIAGRNALDAMFFAGVPATPQSATAARRLLAEGKLSADEKIVLSRILASLHDEGNPTGANLDIELDLKRLADDPNQQVAAQAAIEFARMGYLPGTEDVLKRAFDAGALSADTYYQELAHLVSSAPPPKQAMLMAEISAASNRLASDVLADALISGREKETAAFLISSADMSALLRATQPQFASAAGQFGWVDAVRYSQWLRASATVESDRTGRPVDDLIVGTLQASGTDPRKLMGYLIQPQAGPLLSEAAPGTPVYDMVVAARSYAEQYPSSNMKEIVSGIELRMKHPPEARPAFVFTPPSGPVAPPTPVDAVRLPSSTAGQQR